MHDPFAIRRPLVDTTLDAYRIRQCGKINLKKMAPDTTPVKIIEKIDWKKTTAWPHLVSGESTPYPIVEKD